MMRYLPTGNAPSTLERFITGFYRHRLLIFVVFLVVLGADILITSLLPKKYESRMKVLVRNDRPDLVVSPRANNNGGPNSLPVGENEVNSEVELLKSYDILSAVVRSCNLAKDSKTENVSQGSGTPAFEKAVRQLNKSLSVAPVRKSEVIQVSYTDSSPERAQAVLKSLAEHYLLAHLKVHGTNGTEGFFQTQAKQFGTEMREAEDRLNRFNREHDIVAIDTQKEVILRKAADIEAELRQTEASRQEALSRTGKLNSSLQAISKRVVTQTRVLPNQYSVERLTTMLAELENRRTLALMKFQPDDRVIKEIDQEIANTKEAAEKSAKLSAVEESSDRNPIRSELESELARSEVQGVGLAARVTSLGNALKTFRSRAEDLDRVALEHANLVRNREQAEENYVLYTHKQEEARIAAALDRQKIANVVITESPMAEHLPASPKLAINLALGLLLATFAGATLVLTDEFSRTSISTPGELEALTGIVVLGAIATDRMRRIES